MNEKNMETLIEVIRSQQSTIDEIKTTLTMSDIEGGHIKRELTELKRHFEEFIDNYGLMEAWNQYNASVDQKIQQILED
jgi:hypothetical protein